jgi:DNA repair protein RadA/Sms
LSGAIRPVAHTPSRLKEAAKLGFTRAVVPEAARNEAGDGGLKASHVGGLTTLVADIAALGKPRTAAKTG